MTSDLHSVPEEIVVSETAATSTGIPPSERVLEIVHQLVCETHPGGLHTVTLHTSFERDPALDSLARVELMLRVGKAFCVELPTEALSEADTPRDLLRLLGQAQQEPAPEVVAVLGAAPPTLGIPEHAQTLIDVLEWHAAHQPERLHILLHDEQHKEQTIRYRDLHHGALAIAAGLAARGLQPKQTVALMLPTGRDYLTSFFGVMLAGGIPVPIYSPARLVQIRDHLQRHAGILSNAKAVLIITMKKTKQVAILLQAAVPSLAAIVTPSEITATPMSPSSCARVTSARRRWPNSTCQAGGWRSTARSRSVLPRRTLSPPVSSPAGCAVKPSRRYTAWRNPRSDLRFLLWGADRASM